MTFEIVSYTSIVLVSESIFRTKLLIQFYFRSRLQSSHGTFDNKTGRLQLEMTGMYFGILRWTRRKRRNSYRRREFGSFKTAISDSCLFRAERWECKITYQTFPKWVNAETRPKLQRISQTNILLKRKIQFDIRGVLAHDYGSDRTRRVSKINRRECPFFEREKHIGFLNYWHDVLALSEYTWSLTNLE